LAGDGGTRELPNVPARSICSQAGNLDGPDGDIVPLIIMTHISPTGNFLATIGEFDRLESVTAPSVYYPVGD
jgi:hypothetical protein